MTRDGGFKRRLRRQARAVDATYTKALSERQLLDRQREYYDLRAPDYGDVNRSDRKGGGMMPPSLMSDALDRLAPAGDALELACGPGGFTQALAHRVASLTAVDGSSTMLDRNRAASVGLDVAFVEADLFEWRPPSQFDFVFFGFWLSHVPDTHFDAFWSMVSSCLRPGGRVGFVDEDDRAVGHDDLHVRGGTSTATRTLSDGREFDIVKVFWTPSELTARLERAGWRADVATLGPTYLVGEASPRRRAR